MEKYDLIDTLNSIVWYNGLYEPLLEIKRIKKKIKKWGFKLLI